MNDDKVQDELTNILNKLMSKTNWQTKLQIVGLRMTNTVAAASAEITRTGLVVRSVAIEVVMGTTFIGILQAAYKHPEWLQAVCMETAEMLEDEAAAAGIEDITSWYPVSRIDGDE